MIDVGAAKGNQGRMAEGGWRRPGVS
jgi:hypothetical protein